MVSLVVMRSCALDVYRSDSNITVAALSKAARHATPRIERPFFTSTETGDELIVEGKLDRQMKRITPSATGRNESR
jgi:hypothetical protein